MKMSDAEVQPKPQTYKAFLRESQKRQRQYIEREQERMGEASRLFRLYQVAMLGIGLHPLSVAEISDRQAQLRSMLGEIEATHGDTEGMRAAYELRGAACGAEQAALAA